MTALLVGLLVCVGVAVVVIVVVALPHLREGAPLLAPEGERLAEEARRRAARAASATAGALRERVTPSVGATPVTERPAAVAGEPVVAEPVVAEPVSGEPVSGEPVSGEPVSAEPVSAEPVNAEPVSERATPPRQVASAAATPAPGNRLVVESQTEEHLDRVRAAESR
ncbi:MAG: hypothetical protein ACKVZ6_03525 [Kineosporiaceae bacterium]